MYSVQCAKTTLRYQYSPLRLAKILTFESILCQDYKEAGTFIYFSWENEWDNPYNWQYVSIYQNYKDISFDPTISLQQTYPTDMVSLTV